MTYRQKLSLVLLTGAVAITRFVFRSHSLYDLDSVNFALAMQRFDPHVHQPHPPGYFLYICAGRLLNSAFHDANLALVVLSILASCGVAMVLYKMTLDWFGPTAAQLAGIFFLFSPLAWFHGIVALTYIVEAFFSAFLGYLCWRIYCGRAGFILPAAIVLGVSAGVRPSSIVFLAPLFLFSLRNATPKGRWMGLSMLALALTARCQRRLKCLFRCSGLPLADGSIAKYSIQLFSRKLDCPCVHHSLHLSSDPRSSFTGPVRSVGRYNTG